ncbi:hypothetical protein VULLAG_LOCUS6058 [Vulpes lagopus]
MPGQLAVPARAGVRPGVSCGSGDNGRHPSRREPSRRLSSRLEFKGHSVSRAAARQHPPTPGAGPGCRLPTTLTSGLQQTQMLTSDEPHSRNCLGSSDRPSYKSDVMEQRLVSFGSTDTEASVKTSSRQTFPVAGLPQSRCPGKGDGATMAVR